MIIATGRLSGTYAPANGRTEAITKSPLTGIIGRGNFGGWWGPRLKLAGFEATKVAAGGFIVPYLFVWCPALLLLPTDPLWAALGIIGSVTLITGLQVTICKQYLVAVNPLERGIFALIALVMLLSFPYHSYIALTAGIFLFMLMTIRQWRRRRSTIAGY